MTQEPRRRPADGRSAAERKARGRRRVEAEKLVRLAEYLPLPERELMCSIYERGRPASELARLSGASVRTMQRRVHDLTTRVASPLFAYVINHRRDWPKLRREIGESIVVRGASMRETSKLVGVSLHQVRRELERIRLSAELMSGRRG